MSTAKLKPRARPAPRKRTAWADSRPALAFDRRDAVRKVVLDAACRLYEREGYGGTTMRALAGELRCAPTAVYRYFLNKDEMILALKEVAARVMTSEGAPPDTDDPLADLRAVYWRYYQFSKEHPVYFRLLWADGSTPPFTWSKPPFEGLAQLGQDALHKVQRCIDAGVLTGDVEPADILWALWCAVHGAAAFSTNGAMAGADFDRMAARGLDLVLAGVTRGKPNGRSTKKVKDQK